MWLAVRKDWLESALLLHPRPQPDQFLTPRPQSDGHRIRIGEGFPIEIGNEASSPLQVVRLLQKKEVSYKFHLLDKGA